MDATEKSKWTEEAAKDKERFNEENAAYLAKKQPESLKADDAAPVEMRETANKVEEASGNDMDASHMLETMEEALVKSEVVEEKVKEEAFVKSEEVKEEIPEKKIVKARPRGSLTKEVKGKTSGRGKVLKETVAQTSSVACSSGGGGEIPTPVAKYFAFLFSHWAGVRQVFQSYLPFALLSGIIFGRSIQTARLRRFRTCCGSNGVSPTAAGLRQFPWEVLTVMSRVKHW